MAPVKLCWTAACGHVPSCRASLNDTFPPRIRALHAWGYRECERMPCSGDTSRDSKSVRLAPLTYLLECLLPRPFPFFPFPPLMKELCPPRALAFLATVLGAPGLEGMSSSQSLSAGLAMCFSFRTRTKTAAPGLSGKPPLGRKIFACGARVLPVFIAPVQDKSHQETGSNQQRRSLLHGRRAGRRRFGRIAS